MYFCSKEQTSKQDKAKHSKQNGFQIVTRTPAYCAEHPSTKGCRFSIQSYTKSLATRAFLANFEVSKSLCHENRNLLFGQRQHRPGLLQAHGRAGPMGGRAGPHAGFRRQQPRADGVYRAGRPRGGRTDRRRGAAHPRGRRPRERQRGREYRLRQPLRPQGTDSGTERRLRRPARRYRHARRGVHRGGRAHHRLPPQACGALQHEGFLGQGHRHARRPAVSRLHPRSVDRLHHRGPQPRRGRCGPRLTEHQTGFGARPRVLDGTTGGF